MAHRINERNAGHWTWDGEPKIRRTQKQDTRLSAEEIALTSAVLRKVYESMQFDPDVSKRGHLHPDAKFTDGGRFMLSISREQYEKLFEIIEKIGGFPD